MSHRLSALAEIAEAELKGDPATEITGLAPVRAAQAGDLTFIARDRYAGELRGTKASAVIATPACASKAPDGVALLLSDNPYLAYARVSVLFRRRSKLQGVHPGAHVHPDARIGKACRIDAGAVVGPDATLGNGCSIAANAVVGERCTLKDGCTLEPGVVLYPDCELGEAVRIDGGTVVGSDGFGFAPDGGRWVKIEQCGRVLIGDKVDIGANTTIDRGAIGDTVIKRGAIIDNQVQIAHNVVIGEDTAIAGGTLIAGSVTIGARCQIGGGSCIAGHLSICDDVFISGMTAVSKSISRKGVYTSVIPAMERGRWSRNVAWFRRLDKIFGKRSEHGQNPR